MLGGPKNHPAAAARPLPDQKAVLYVRLMSDRMRATIGLTAWIAFVSVAVVGLHSLHRFLPLGAIWSLASSLELALGAMLRLLGLVAGYWLLGSTLVYLLLRVTRVRDLRSVAWSALPLVRQLSDRITARAMVRVFAAPIPLLDLVTPGYVPIPASDPQAPAAISQAPIAETPVVVTTADEAVEVIILRGDNMWTLAKARLEALHGRPPTDAEIGPYWRRVVEVNLDRIRSGDPDLIFPGEVLILPPA